MQELPVSGKNILFCNHKPVIFNTQSSPVLLYHLEKSIDNVKKSSFFVICFTKRKQLKQGAHFKHKLNDTYNSDENA
jgi:hypothetical protein